jgi:DNA-binding transcriptional LysR family regulator
MRSRLDSRSLSLFLAVADTLSFRQAAETLHMSQPPLSRAIRELEERLGVRLFTRSTHGVGLTDSGLRLLPYARQVAALLHEAQAALSAPGSQLCLRIGMTNAVEPPWFNGLIERIQAAQPATEVAVAYDTSPRLVRQLQGGKLTAAFVALPTQVQGLDVVKLDHLPMVVAVPGSHRLARRKKLRLADLASEPVFWFERARQPAFYDHCERIFARHELSFSKLREPSDHHVLLAQVASGMGLALLPRSFAGLKRTGVVYKDLVEGEELGVGIGLATRHDQEAVRALLVQATGLRPAHDK